jgi:hypothetical protein
MTGPSEADRAAFAEWYEPVRKHGLVLPPLPDDATPSQRAEHMRYAMSFWMIEKDVLLRERPERPALRLVHGAPDDDDEDAS